jgi:hypothetical protein
MSLLEIGRDMRDAYRFQSGRKVTFAPRVFFGAAANPFGQPFDWRAQRLAKKVEAGAQFIQTQYCYDVPRLRTFMQEVEDLGLLGKVFILVGVGPMRSAKVAQWMRSNVPGVHIPDAIIKRIADNHAAALKRKQAAADADMAQFTPRCRAKLEISEQAENFEMALKRENKPPVHPASIRQITAPAVPTNCNCIKCAGVRATPIVAKCVLCDASVVYSICTLHYPNTLSFHNEVQARSRSILCFFCKNVMDA